MSRFLFFFVFAGICVANAQNQADTLDDFHINDQEYLERRGANVMLAHDFYPESHQGGVGIIQNGLRVATNGDLRLEPAPGQWQPVPKVGQRKVDRQEKIISVRMQYPDSSKNRTGFNPIIYPDLNLSYTLKVKPEGKSFKIIIDLDEPLPEDWVGKVGLNIELFPGILFGKSFYMDDEFGIFPRQADGPGFYNEDDEYRLQPLAIGKKLVVAPGTPAQTLTIQNLGENKLELLDGRAIHSNGWYVVRSLVPPGKTKGAVEWLVTPNALKDYTYQPVVQISQVGYHPGQEKKAVIETDKNTTDPQPVHLMKIEPEGGYSEVLSKKPEKWGNFLRYKYFTFDFSEVKEPGMYVIKYSGFTTVPFKISKDVYKRGVWQPTLEYFLPVQMCHMRVNDRYKVWHGLCHMDDARMAPVDTNHFDGYLQGHETLTKYKGGEHVPGLNIGGWHDAGDYDLRVESQASTIQGLTHIYEIFDVQYDNTSIDEKNRLVEILQPDGIPDIIQQIEHGALSIVGGYESLGRFYRGIISPTKRQYVLLGDPVNQTDNKIYSEKKPNDTTQNQGGSDDRGVFTENNPPRELATAAALAASARVLKEYDPELAAKCLQIARETWNSVNSNSSLDKVDLAAELLQTTREEKYADFILKNKDDIISNFGDTGWRIGPILSLIGNKKFTTAMQEAARNYYKTIEAEGEKTPYGVPYEPNIWGAGWGIQNFGMKQYFLHTSYPEVFPEKYLLDALNFILGAHPGVNTSSFASGVGARSITQAYGMNRGDFSFIPGGIGSGTALIRPDFPELLEWSFLWQQTEYVLGGGTTDYLFLVLAADKLLNEKP
ncbi:glycoside hydrolase [Christiangramia fulva]|uniref:Glycoside hydrolase n=1 Tax=Christiangramia fulva TaxID=2126553 RepID=A0A2R3Z2Y0_9FLAO|nr:glycoside hydrolase family 9 protein [Christiangramia fulva]AVR44592.1 glycoside hydrolase [Christiangramia fulva]